MRSEELFDAERSILRPSTVHKINKSFNRYASGKALALFLYAEKTVKTC